MRGMTKEQVQEYRNLLKDFNKMLKVIISNQNQSMILQEKNLKAS